MNKIKVFGNPDCTRCRAMFPILMELFQQDYDIEFFMEEGNEQLFFEEEIEDFPTIKFYRNGVFYKKFVGIVSKEEIVKAYNYKTKKIFVYASEGCSRSKKMKPIFEELENDISINFKIFWMEKEWTIIFSELERLENWPTIRFYNEGEIYKEIVGMVTKQEILDIYNEVK